MPLSAIALADRRPPPHGVPPAEAAGYADMFDLAPVSLWLEDYSGLRAQFREWRAARVSDLRAWLAADPARAAACSRRIRIIRVNRRTLALFEAADERQLAANLDRIFRDEMLAAHIDELAQLWEGATSFYSNTVNYTLLGKRLDIQLKGSILPGYEESWARVLVAVEDVTEREQARRELAQSELYARGLFDHSPVSLWVEDFSAVRRLLDEARRRGVADLRAFIDANPDFVRRCMDAVRVLDVNRQTLRLFAAPDKPTLLRRLEEVFRDPMLRHFGDQLVDLWHGRLTQCREVVNYALNGDELCLHLQFSVLPGCEEDWSRVLLAMTDITARRKAEAYLEYLGRHDSLTKLYNRSFFADELARVERQGPFPVSIVMIDLNGLKCANDYYGHGAGDALLRRAGEVLSEATGQAGRAARIGGDEFALLLPATDSRGAAQVIERIEKLIAVNNQFYPGLPLSLAMGAATAPAGEPLETVCRRADEAMYAAKRAHYQNVGQERATHARRPG